MNSRNKHLDMETLVKQVEEGRQSDLAYRAICLGDPAALKRLEDQARDHLSIDALKDPDFGPRQVESFLRIMDRELDEELELAEMDNIVYDSLGEHRILGQRKSK